MEEDWDLVDSLSSSQLSQHKKDYVPSRPSLDFTRFDYMPTNHDLDDPISPLLGPHEETEDLFCQSPLPDDSFYEQQDMDLDEHIENDLQQDIEALEIKDQATKDDTESKKHAQHKEVDCSLDVEEQVKEESDEQEEEEEDNPRVQRVPDGSGDEASIENIPESTSSRSTDSAVQNEHIENDITHGKIDAHPIDDDTMDRNNESNGHCDIYPVDHGRTHFDFLFTSFVNPTTAISMGDTTRESDADRNALWKNTTTGSSVPFMTSQSLSSESNDSTPEIFTIPPLHFTPQPLLHQLEVKKKFEQLQEKVSLDSLSEDGSIVSNRPIKSFKRRIPNSSGHRLSVHTLSPFACSPKRPPVLVTHQPLSPVAISPLADEPENQIPEPDPAMIQRDIAACFSFAHTVDNEIPEGNNDDEYGLATLLFELERHSPLVTEWSRLTKLNLSRQNLTTVRSLKTCFPCLEILQISHNQLKTISELPSSLIYLYASHNKLSEINLNGLDKLQHLDLSNNTIIGFEDMSCLKSLRRLDVSHNAITSCKPFQSLAGLVHLNLRANCLRRLVNFEAIVRNNQLESLDVSLNRIERLDSIENLKQLRELNANHNDIQYIQLDKPMERLCKLQLSFNRLKSFDTSLFPNIHVLYLDDNQIQRIIGMASITRLDSFSIRDQGGQPIEYTMQCLRGIRKLYLSGSPLASLKQMIDFYSLQYLELCSAGLEQLPSDFGRHVPNLVTLNLSMNRLKDIRPLRKLRYLKNLVLIDNRLMSLNEVIQVVQYLRQLHTLDLRQNPLSSNIYPVINTSCLQSIHEQERISPYIFLLKDQDWVFKDVEFYEGLSDHWKTRRQVYRALLVQKCPRLKELDHIKIESTDRSEGDIVIDNFRRSQTPHTSSTSGSFSY